MNPLQSLDQIELNIKLVHNYKSGDRLNLQLNQCPEAKQQLCQWALDFLDECLGADEALPIRYGGGPNYERARNQFRDQAKATALSLLKQGGQQGRISNTQERSS